MDAEKRFERLTQNDIRTLIQNEKPATNQNTKRSTNTWVNVYKSWAAVRGKKIDIEEYKDPSELNEVLGQFYGEVRKKNGVDYGPDCLRVMQASFNRYLLDKQYPRSILNDIEFISSRKVLEGKIRGLRQVDLSKRSNVNQALTASEENLLWELDKLGKSSPITLLHTIWYFNIQHFGRRSRQEQVAVTMENFQLKVDEQLGKKYIEFKERNQNGIQLSRKMFETGGDRCPITFFEFYVSKRPTYLRDSGRFYLSPYTNYDSEGPWFSLHPIGKNRIGSFMKEILSGTQLKHCRKQLTNHVITKNTSNETFKQEELTINDGNSSQETEGACEVEDQSIEFRNVSETSPCKSSAPVCWVYTYLSEDEQDIQAMPTVVTAYNEHGDVLTKNSRTERQLSLTDASYIKRKLPGVSKPAATAQPSTLVGATATTNVVLRPQNPPPSSVDATGIPPHKMVRVEESVDDNPQQKELAQKYLDLLCRLYPEQKRRTLELVLKGCDYDLVLAIEYVLPSHERAIKEQQQQQQQQLSSTPQSQNYTPSETTSKQSGSSRTYPSDNV